MRHWVLVLVSFFSLVSVASGETRQPILERAATALTGLNITVNCETTSEHRLHVAQWDEDFYAASWIAQREILISPGTCARFVGSGESRDFAVFVFAHELGHIKLRTSSEEQANEYAFLRWSRLFDLLEGKRKR